MRGKVTSASQSSVGVRNQFLVWRRAAIDHLDTDSTLLGAAAVIGAGTGLLAAALIELIDITQSLTWGRDATWIRLLLVPTAGAFAVGLLIRYLVPESQGSGIIRTMETIAIRGGRFHGRVPLGGLTASGLAIGTGAAGGREGPIVLIGGSLGSLVGRLLAFDEERLRTLVAAGAAAGIGASFNAPIGGMLFAAELLIGGFRARSFQAVLVASVAGSVTARQLIGPEIIYRPEQTYRLEDPRELILYALLGLAATGIGLAFLYGEDRAKALFARLPVWLPIRLAIGGLALGMVALAVPEVLGTGDGLPPIDGNRAPIQSLLDGTIGTGYGAAGFMLLLAVTKIVATCLSIGSGNAVGTFAPVIFTGAAFGGAMGNMAQQLLPSVGIAPGAFALVGMSAAFGAAARAPLTAIVIVFEITGDYELVLPLMLATGLATFLADRITSDTVYTMPLRKKGIVYAEPDDVDIMQTVQVGEIMTRDPQTVSTSTTLEELRLAFQTSGHHGFPVLRPDGRLAGLVTRHDVERLDEDIAGGDTEADADLTVGDICTRDIVTVVPNDPVFRAMQRMAFLDVGRIPVVAQEDHHKLLGLVRRSDLVAAYQQAVARSMTEQQRRDSSRIRDLVGVRFVELSVDPASTVNGMRVEEANWPPRTVLTSIRRSGEIIVPRGDTMLLGGDEIVALADPDAVDQLRHMFAASTEPEHASEDTENLSWH